MNYSEYDLSGIAYILGFIMRRNICIAENLRMEVLRRDNMIKRKNHRVVQKIPRIKFVNSIISVAADSLIIMNKWINTEMQYDFSDTKKKKVLHSISK